MASIGTLSIRVIAVVDPLARGLAAAGAQMSRFSAAATRLGNLFNGLYAGVVGTATGFSLLSQGIASIARGFYQAGLAVVALGRGILEIVRGTDILRFFREAGAVVRFFFADIIARSPILTAVWGRLRAGVAGMLQFISRELAVVRGLLADFAASAARVVSAWGQSLVSQLAPAWQRLRLAWMVNVKWPVLTAVDVIYLALRNLGRTPAVQGLLWVAQSIGSSFMDLARRAMHAVGASGMLRLAWARLQAAGAYVAQGMGKIGQGLQTFYNAARSVIGGIAGVVGPIITLFLSLASAAWEAAKRIALIGAVAVTALFVKGTQAVATTARLAREFGLGYNQMKLFQEAAERSGFTVQQVESWLGKFNEEMAAAGAGSARVIKTLRALGIDARKLAALDPDTRFFEALKQIKSLPVGQRAFAAEALLGRDAKRLVAILNNPRMDLGRLEDFFKRTGGLLRDEEVSKVEQAKEAIDNIKSLFETIGIKLAAEIGPVISVIVEDMIAWATAGDGIEGKLDGVVGKSIQLAATTKVAGGHAAEWAENLAGALKFTGAGDFLIATTGLGKMMADAAAPAGEVADEAAKMQAAYEAIQKRAQELRDQIKVDAEAQRELNKQMAFMDRLFELGDRLKVTPSFDKFSDDLARVRSLFDSFDQGHILEDLTLAGLPDIADAFAKSMGEGMFTAEQKALIMADTLEKAAQSINFGDLRTVGVLRVGTSEGAGAVARAFNQRPLSAQERTNAILEQLRRHQEYAVQYARETAEALKRLKVVQP